MMYELLKNYHFANCCNSEWSIRRRRIVSSIRRHGDFISLAASSGKRNVYFAHVRGAKYCDEYVRVCLCVSLSLREDISGTARAIFTNFCACCLWLWLGPPPARLRHVMYFRFCGWHNVFSTPPGPWLPAAWYNKGCIHRLANPRKGCVSIAISMSVYLSVCLPARRSTKLHVRSLPNLNACCLRSWLDLPPAKGAKSTTIYDCLVRSGVRLSVCPVFF